jgi:hypothetical protein
MVSEVINRTFGLQPINYCPSCRTAIVETKINNFNQITKCPKCKERLTVRSSSFPLEVFQKHQQLVNALIRFGNNLPTNDFINDSSKAVKAFYNKLNKKKNVKMYLKKVGMPERLQRCAAQPAYFAIRGQRQRIEIVSLIAGLFSQKIQKILNERNISLDNSKRSKYPDFIRRTTSLRGSKNGKNSNIFDWLMGNDFPKNKLINEVREVLEDELTVFETGYLTTPHLSNLLGQAKNLLLKKLKNGFKVNDYGVIPINEMIVSDHLERGVASWFKTNKNDFAKKFMSNLSRLVTNRFKDISRGFGPDWGKGNLDPYVQEVIGNVPIKKLNRSVWDILRKKWRNRSLKYLELVLFQTNTYELLGEGIISSLEELTPARIIRELSAKSKRFKNTTDLDQSWYNFLIHHIRAKTVSLMVKSSLPMLMTRLFNFADDLHHFSAPWFKIPTFKAQSIAYGADDGRIFKIVICNDSRKGQKAAKFNVSTKSDDVIIRLIFFNQKKPNFLPNSMTFKLNTPERFYDLLKEGYNYMAPTLTKKAGGALKLSFPFEKITKKKKVKKTKDKDKIMGVDLGLKVWAMISIVEGLDIIKQEDYLSKDDFNKLFEGVYIGKHEVARYFLDQEELTGKASDWWKNSNESKKSNESKESKESNKFFDFKKKLMHLRRKAKELQSQLDNYKKKHKNYRNKVQFFITKRELQRVWLRINHFHEEIAKQLAARIVQLALFHGVTLIRFENLKWSSHSPKEEVGYWLSTWQIHWFFSEIIRRVNALASRNGIKFELINARNTSQRCSKCGRLGTRKGKAFVCHHCKNSSGSPRQLDSDLNGARNITIAPLPLSQWRKRTPPVLGTT